MYFRYFFSLTLDVEPLSVTVGFCITFGTLLAKIRRVYALFRAAEQMQRLQVTRRETVSIVGAILWMDMAILTVWTVTDPLEWKRTVLIRDKYGTPLSSVGYCVSDHWVAFAGAIGTFHLVLLVMACYMCYVARNLPTLFSEGKYLAIAMISNVQIFVLAVPVLVILGDNMDTQASFFVKSMAIWANDLVVVLLIFGNFMFHHALASGSSHHAEMEPAPTRNELVTTASHSFYISRRNSNLLLLNASMNNNSGQSRQSGESKDRNSNEMLVAGSSGNCMLPGEVVVQEKNVEKETNNGSAMAVP